MEYIENFIEYLDENEKTQNTIDSYIRDIKQFFEFVSIDIEALTKKEIRKYIRYLKDKNLNIKSINRKLSSLNQFIKFLNEEYELKISVQIKNQKIQSQEYLEEMLNKEDFELLIKKTEEKEDHRAKAIFYTLFYTGMRISEALQLKIEDIEKEVILIKGKGNKYRKIFIPEKLTSIWSFYASHRIHTSDYLFTGIRGPLTRFGVHKLIKKYGKLCNLKPSVAHAHSFRHLFCLSMIEKGISIDVVADLAGHTNINTTRIYTRKTTKELVSVINEL